MPAAKRRRALKHRERGSGRTALTRRNAGLRPHDSRGRGRVVHELRGGANRPPHELTAAIGADETEFRGGAFQAIRALEGANVSFAGIRREIAVAAFAVGS